MGWLFDVLGISVDGFVSSIFNGIINWIYVRQAVITAKRRIYCNPSFRQRYVRKLIRTGYAN